MSYNGTVVCDIFAENFKGKEILPAEIYRKAKGLGNAPYISTDVSTARIQVAKEPWLVQFDHYYDELDNEWRFAEKARNLIEMEVKAFVKAGTFAQPIITAYNQFITWYENQSFKNAMMPLAIPFEYTAANGIKFHVYKKPND